MPLSVTGISHKTAPVELRERVAFVGEEIPAALKSVCELPDAREAVLLSTCNRMEIVRNAENDGRDLLYWLEQMRNVPAELLGRHSYTYTETEAALHLARVSCGMDSMAFGEPQILGQVKQAFALARECGAAGSDLHALHQHLFRIAKRVRSETRIGENAISLASAVLTLARRLFTELEKRNIVFIGVGEMIESIAQRMKDQGVSQRAILNRSADRARELAQKTGAASGPLSEIDERLRSADALISCTGSGKPIIGVAAVRDAVRRRRHRPLLIIDLAVPRDVEPAVGELSEVYLYDVDNLRELVEQGARARAADARQAEALIAEGVREYRRAMRAQDADELIAGWRNQIEGLKTQELERARKRLQQGADPTQVMEQLAHALANKLMHAPSAGLRRAGAEGDARLLAQARELLGVKTDAGDENDEP